MARYYGGERPSINIISSDEGRRVCYYYFRTGSPVERQRVDNPCSSFLGNRVCDSQIENRREKNQMVVHNCGVVQIRRFNVFVFVEIYVAENNYFFCLEITFRLQRKVKTEEF